MEETFLEDFLKGDAYMTDETYILEEENTEGIPHVGDEDGNGGEGSGDEDTEGEPAPGSDDNSDGEDNE